MDMSNKMWSDEGWAQLLSELTLDYMYGDVQQAVMTLFDELGVKNAFLYKGPLTIKVKYTLITSFVYNIFVSWCGCVF